MQLETYVFLKECLFLFWFQHCLSTLFSRGIETPVFQSRANNAESITVQYYAMGHYLAPTEAVSTITCTVFARVESLAISKLS